MLLPPQPHAHVVLVVEDDTITREATEALLDAEGHAVLCAATGAEALSLVHREPPPCIILLDLMMDGLSGQAFRRAQLADRKVRDIPVILVSGISDLPRHARELEAALYLPKPIDVARLVAAIPQLCTRTTAVA
ncbi:MAG TPA: response regulator [Candidatus Binatia bacterium]|jgi:CheY-like chemotaxis protein